MSIIDRTVDRCWWALSDRDEMARSLDAAMRVGMESARARKRLNDLGGLARLFEEHNDQVAFGALDDAGLLPRNVLCQIVETAHNHLTDQHPRPFYGSSGGDADLRFRLEDLNTAITGLFLMHDVDQHADLAQLHAILWGVGILKVDAITHTKAPRVVVERVYPWEVFVDPLDAAYGKPTTFYQVRFVDRRRLMAMWPRKRREIEEAQSTRPEWASWLETMADPVRVVEAWHLDQDGLGEGRHVIAIDRAILLDEEYLYDAPPLIEFRYGDPLTGYWPTGLGHALRGQQIEVNEQMDLIQEIVARMASPALLVEKNSEVEEGHLDNTVGRVIRYQGVAPQAMAPQGLTGEPRAHLQDTIVAMHERSGLPQSSTTGTKAPGITSGRGLRIQADLASGRLRVPSEQRQRSYLALGHALIRAQRKLAQVMPDATIIFTDPKNKAVKEIRWADVDVADEGLKLMAQPISSLPSTPGAKAAVLDEYLGGGIITPDEYREAIGLADLLALDGTASAPRRLIEHQILGILRDGVEAVPESYLPLPLAQQLAQQHYCQAQLDGVDEVRLGMLRAYIDIAIDLQKPPPPPAAPMPPEGAPPPDLPPPADAGPIPPDLAAALPPAA